MREVLVDYPTYAQLGYGAIVVLIVVFAPTGLAGLPVPACPGVCADAGAADSRRRRRWSRSSRSRRPLRPLRAAATSSAGRLRRGPLLTCDSITMHFRGLKALDDVSLTVAAGEIRGIVGPNGSGKTTLFNVVSGLYRPTGGRVALAGAGDHRRPRRTGWPSSGVARTFQNLRLFGDLTVRDNVLVALDRTRTWSSWRYVVCGRWASGGTTASCGAGPTTCSTASG